MWSLGLCPRAHVPTCPRAHVPTCPRANCQLVLAVRHALALRPGEAEDEDKQTSPQYQEKCVRNTPKDVFLLSAKQKKRDRDADNEDDEVTMAPMAMAPMAMVPMAMAPMAMAPMAMAPMAMAPMAMAPTTRLVTARAGPRSPKWASTVGTRNRYHHISNTYRVLDTSTSSFVGSHALAAHCRCSCRAFPMSSISVCVVSKRCADIVLMVRWRCAEISMHSPGGLAAWLLGGFAARRLGGLAAWRLGGLAVARTLARFNCATAAAA